MTCCKLQPRPPRPSQDMGNHRNTNERSEARNEDPVKLLRLVVRQPRTTNALVFSHLNYTPDMKLAIKAVSAHQARPVTAVTTAATTPSNRSLPRGFLAVHNARARSADPRPIFCSLSTSGLAGDRSPANLYFTTLRRLHHPRRCSRLPSHLGIGRSTIINTGLHRGRSGRFHGRVV